MTVNQLILLLDIHRGYDPARHVKMLWADLEYLCGVGLIRPCATRPGVPDPDYETTFAGQCAVEAIKRATSPAVAMAWFTSRPKWTVLYNQQSPENDRWVGTGWEFFDREEDAEAAYERHIEAGDTPTKRPYYHNTDYPHLGAVHLIRRPEQCQLSKLARKPVTAT